MFEKTIPVKQILSISPSAVLQKFYLTIQQYISSSNFIRILRLIAKAGFFYILR